MPSPTMSANVRGTIGGTRKQRGAEKLPEEFPNTWADAWDGYEYTMLAEGQSTNSTRTRRSSVLRLAKAYPSQEPETLTRRDHRTSHYRRAQTPPARHSVQRVL